MRVHDWFGCVTAALNHTLLDDLLLFQVLIDVQEALCQVDLLLGCLNRRSELEPLILRLIHCFSCRRRRRSRSGRRTGSIWRNFSFFVVH